MATSAGNYDAMASWQETRFDRGPRTSFPIFLHRDTICSVNAQPRIVHQFEVSMQNK